MLQASQPTILEQDAYDCVEAGPIAPAKSNFLPLLHSLCLLVLLSSFRVNV